MKKPTPENKKRKTTKKWGGKREERKRGDKRKEGEGRRGKEREGEGRRGKERTKHPMMRKLKRMKIKNKQKRKGRK